jgi:hypothetical protein
MFYEVRTDIFRLLSCVLGSMTKNSGLWIGWLALLALLLQLKPIITAHKQWLPKTRSVPYWTTCVFSSTVIDLVLIYESVTSSASIVRWLTLHSWTLNYRTVFSVLLCPNDLWLTKDEWRTKNDSRIKVKVNVTLLLAVYRQSVLVGVRPLEAHYQKFFPNELFR